MKKTLIISLLAALMLVSAYVGAVYWMGGRPSNNTIS